MNAVPSHPVAHDALAARIGALPALPTVAGVLLRVLGDENADLGSLARQIAADQALAARALRVANSPFYGLRGRIDSIQEAIVVLGFRAVRSLVISAAIVRTLSTVRTDPRFDAEVFWRHGVAVAVAARHLAVLSGNNVDASFTAGLLHDVGQLVLAVAAPECYGAMLAWREQHGGFAVDAERQVLGITHAEAGAMLASHWGLPAAIVEAIALHHRPEDAAGQPLVAVAHAADVVAHGLGLATGQEELVPPLSDRVWKQLDIPWPQLSSALGRIETEFEDTLHALVA